MFSLVQQRSHHLISASSLWRQLILLHPPLYAVTFRCLATVTRKRKSRSEATMSLKKQNKSPTMKTTTIKKKQLLFQQCAGLRKKDGKPCERKIPVDPQQVSPTTLMYCHDHRPALHTANAQLPLSLTQQYQQQHQQQHQQKHQFHTKEWLTEVDPPPLQTCFDTQVKHTIQTSPLYDCWSLWIRKHIHVKKRNQIRQEMIKPYSEKDEAGYLYAYRLIQGPRVSTDNYCYFKIGRSTNPTRRISQVINSCNYQPQLLDILPSVKKRSKAELEQQALALLSSSSSSSSSPPLSITAADNPYKKNHRLLKCPMSHRVERLIHLELSAMYPIKGGFKCKVCGTTHREWFRVKRSLVQEGQGWRKMTDQEVWVTNVRPVLLHWIQYGVVASASLQALASSPPPTLL